jgi:hypothetical protein
MHKTLVHIEFSTRQLATLLGLLFLMNLLVLAGTWAATLYFNQHGWNANPSLLKNVLFQLNLALENVAATWYSSMLLLTTAVMAGICFLADRQEGTGRRQRLFSYGWLVFCGVFALLSFDEMGSVHEYFGKDAYNEQADGFTRYAGLVVLYTGIALVAGFMVAFGLVHLRRVPWSFVLVGTGVLLFISNPFQEHFEWGFYQRGADRPVLLLLLEEGSELFGTLCFLAATVAYAAHVTRRQPAPAGRAAIRVTATVSRKPMLATVLAVLGAMAVLLVGLQLVVGKVEDPRLGIPQNWIPSAIAFAVALVSRFLFAGLPREGARGGLFLGLLAGLALALSAYYGSNLYATKGLVMGTLLTSLLLAILVGVSSGLLVTTKDARARLGIAAWAGFTGLALTLGRPYSAELAFAGFACLLATLLAYALRQQLLAGAHASGSAFAAAPQLTTVESAV